VKRITVAKNAKLGLVGDGRKLVAGVVDPGPSSARTATTRRCFLGVEGRESMVERRFLRLDSLTPRLFVDATMPGNSPVCTTDL
jgi:hypothetical protein